MVRSLMTELMRSPGLWTDRARSVRTASVRDAGALVEMFNECLTA
jgi:hypothetical protein